MNTPASDRSDPVRTELAAAQSELLRHLLSDGSAPPGFDAADLARTRTLLQRKARAGRGTVRRRGVAAWLHRLHRILRRA